MGFFLKAALGLVIVLGIADYRIWRDITAAAQHSFDQTQLEALLLQQMTDRRYAVHINTVELIPGGEADELGLRVGVSDVFDPSEIHSLELDLRAYQVDQELRFARPCLRPSPEIPGRVYRSELAKKFAGASYSVAVGGTPTKSGYSPVRPVRGVELRNDSVTLSGGLLNTFDEGQDMLTGEAWEECGS